MNDYFTYDQISEVANQVSSRIKEAPNVGMILGSGLGSLAESVADPTVISYGDLSHWPVSTVEGHHGQLVIGELEGQQVLVMQGRAHYYEGYSMAHIGLPVRVMQRLGIGVIVVTNAAGGVNPDFEPGDPMMLTDHLNLIGMAGLTPLRGPNLEQFGTRFPDMGRVYDRELWDVLRKVATEGGIQLNEGVYACLAGPSFETPADLRFLHTIGVDAVGMSTVPEATVARHGGMRVVGLSGISNKANLDGDTLTTHEEVLEAGGVLVPKLETLIRGLLRSLKS